MSANILFFGRQINVFITGTYTAPSIYNLRSLTHVHSYTRTDMSLECRRKFTQVHANSRQIVPRLEFEPTPLVLHAGIANRVVVQTVILLLNF